MASEILIVEDDIYLREGLSELLSKEGYSPVTAGNISEGKRLFSENIFDLIILDVMLPDGSGLELCTFIRKKGNNSLWWLFILTGIVIGAAAGFGIPFLIKDKKQRKEDDLRL